MRILPAKAMSWVEKATVEKGLGDFDGLMEAAGRAAARSLLPMLPCAQAPVLILCGKGNNGGDGLVVARKFANAGVPVTVAFLMGERLSPLAQKNLEALRDEPKVRILQGAGLPYQEKRELCGSAAMIIDGVFGTGFSGKLPEDCGQWMEAANRSEAVRAALDIPSGMDCDTGFFDLDTFKAHATCAFGALKPAHLLKSSRELCGEVRLMDIGLSIVAVNQAPCGITLLDEELARKLLPPRREDSNKGDYGRLLAMGGCTSMAGAILMASMAAMSSGVGMVKAAIPAGAAQLLNGKLPEALCCPMEADEAGAISPKNAGRLAVEAGWATALLLGCGLSVGEGTKQLTEFLLQNASRPMVIDADGLNCLAGQLYLLGLAKAPVVLTPHMKEMSRLIGKDIPQLKRERFRAAGELAAETGAVVVLKDSNTVVAAPDGRLWMNTNGSCGMAKAGSGDVLAGLIGGLLAQGLPPEDAACLGVYLHAAAGEAAAKRLTPYCMKATDIIAALPEAFSQLM